MEIRIGLICQIKKLVSVVCVMSYFIIIIILIYLVDPAFKALIMMERKQDFIRQGYDKVDVFKSRDETLRQSQTQGQLTIFRAVQQDWRAAYHSLCLKLRHIEGCCSFPLCHHEKYSALSWDSEVSYLCINHCSNPTNTYKPLPDPNPDNLSKLTKLSILPPHEYFEPREQALFRNLLCHWQKWNDVDEPDWYYLPGPRKWWKGYKFDKHNWDPDLDSKGAKQAFKLVRGNYGKRVPRLFARLAPSEHSLSLMVKGASEYLL